MTQKEYYICVYDPLDTPDDAEFEMSVHLTWEAACAQRCIYLISSMQRYMEREQLTFDDLPTDFTENLLKHIADSEYAQAWQLWDSWTSATNQEDWIQIQSIPLSKPKDADVIAAVDSILDIDVVSKKAEADQAQEDVKDEWAAVKAALTLDGTLVEEPKVDELKVEYVAKPEEKKETQLDLPQISRDGSISSLFRVEDQQKHVYKTTVQVDFIDHYTPRSEKITFEENLNGHGVSSQFHVGQSVTVYRLKGKSHLAPRVNNWAAKTVFGAKKETVVKEPKVISGGACAVPKIPFEILSREV